MLLEARPQAAEGLDAPVAWGCNMDRRILSEKSSG